MVDLPAPERPTRPIFSPGRMSRQKSSSTGRCSRRAFSLYEKSTCSKRMPPCFTTSGTALGLSSTVCGRVSVLMPSRMVPMFSKSEADCHMIHCDSPLMRSAMAVAAATAPGLALPWCQSHRPMAAEPPVSSMFTVCDTTSSVVTQRIWACTVTMKSSMAERA